LARQSRLASLYGNTNLAGGPRREPVLRDLVAETLVLGTLSGTYYRGERDVAALALEVARRGWAADPRFTAAAAVYARERGYVRAAPLAALATGFELPETAPLAARIFPRIVRHAGDLRDLIALFLSGALRRRFGGRAQRTAAAWLANHLDEYQAMKYLGRGAAVSLADALRLTHPRPRDEVQAALFRWVLRRPRPGDLALLPRVAALEMLPSAKPDEAARLIAEHGLPFEAAVPRLGSVNGPATWAALAERAPYLWLVRALASLHRHGAFALPGVADRVAGRIADGDAVRRAMVFPHQFALALRALPPGAPPQVAAAVTAALLHSVSNVPRIRRRALVALDVSGSMLGSRDRGVAAYQIGALFAWALARASDPPARVVAFNTEWRDVTEWARRCRTPDDFALRLQDEEICGGGTDLAQAVLAMRDEEVLVAITDSEDWAGEGFARAWARRKAADPAARAVLVQLMPYGDRVDTPQNGCVYVYGWGEDALRLAAEAVEDGVPLADRIAEMTETMLS